MKSGNQMEVSVENLLPCRHPVRLRKMIPLAPYATVRQRRRHPMNEPENTDRFVFS